MFPPRGQGNCAARRARAAPAKNWAGRYRALHQDRLTDSLRRDLDDQRYRVHLEGDGGLSVIARPRQSVMRNPQDDLLVVFELVELAHDHKGTPTENHALDLVAKIADQHGLTTTEVFRQLKERNEAHCWGKIVAKAKVTNQPPRLHTDTDATASKNCSVLPHSARKPPVELTKREGYSKGLHLDRE